MIESIEKLRESLKDCAREAGVEPNRFDTYWITARACDMLIDEIEAEIESRYMELPCDADGVPIHPGNRVELDGKGGEVWLVGTTDVMCNDGMSYRAVAVNHAKPDPLKELLSELANEVWEASCTCQTTWSDSGLDGIEERYAERIRELMEVDA